MYEKYSSERGQYVPMKVASALSSSPNVKSLMVLNIVIGAVLVNGSYAYAQTELEPQEESSVTTTLPVLMVEGEQDAESTYQGSADQILESNNAGFLGNKDALETPFSAISYTDKFVDDQQATDIVGVISATDASVYSNEVVGENLESYSIRGFSTNSNDVTLNGLSGMAPYYRSAPEMFDRVEVLKGPSALLNGMSPNGSVGGSVNLQTKRAGEEPLTRLTTKYRSDSQVGGHLDVGRRFGENNEWGMRFNGAYSNGDTSIDSQEKESNLGSLGIDWRGERLRLSADIYRTKEEVDGPTRGITVASAVDIPHAPDADNPLSPSWAFYHSQTQGIITRGEYDVNDQLSIYAAAGQNEMDYEGLSASKAEIFNSAGDYNTTLGYVDDDNKRVSLEAGLRYHFHIGGISHQLVTNTTHYKETYNLNAVRFSDQFTTNIYAPDWSNKPNLDLNAPLLLTTETTLTSVGLADTLSFDQDRYQLTVGARHQMVKTEQTGGMLSTDSIYDESAVTPSVAFVTRLSDQTSVYANYMEGLSAGGTAPALSDNAGEIFAPYKTKQKEIGLKFDQGNFTHNLAIYEIERPSSYTDSETNVYGYYGEQRNRGIEWGFYGTPFDHLRLMGGITYLDAKITSANDVSQIGNQASGIPEWQAKLGAEWDTPFMEELTLTANATSASKSYLDDDNDQSISGRTIFGVGARYSMKIDRMPLTVRASIDNLMDKSYWSMAHYNDLAVGEGRTFKLSASVDF